MIGDFIRHDSSGGILARFTRDLTADARAGRLEPVRCRDQEVARVIDILLRHGKNNPTLVGPAGVGKTAIAEGLAQRIAAGNVPLTLRPVRLLSLDHVALLAGTTYRGQYEERIRAIVAETTAASDVILFIDELHNLIGQGTAIGTAMDAANMLKPALVRGDFRVIGATTSDEYERWVEGDPALERRFQKLVVRELGDLETLEILHARKERLERHHNVLISDEALRAAVRLTDDYVTDRMRPDKAIDALDEACAHMQAVTQYSARAEELIRRRMAALKDEARAERAEREQEAGRARERESVSAFQRFGAELEALFVGAAPAAPPPADEPAASPAAPEVAPVVTLALAEAELARQLMEEGVVVRGHDVARVVGLMAETDVEWSE
ncbi:MAG TPA: AAA family ATPase [Gemmatimonadaceae bacterium]|nr:AAA family ATPase [Gemmatimonadaceae bacterium]